MKRELVLSIILYNADIDYFLKSLSILNTIKHHHDFIIAVRDNNDGKQIDELKNKLRKFDTSFRQNFIFIPSTNVGFGKGHNLTFKTIEYDCNYFLIANPDGVFHCNTIRNLLFKAQETKNRGIYEAIEFPLENKKGYDRTTFETEWCTGSCLLFPSKIFKEVNGFDEDIFLYCEDVDISWRVRIAGYKCYTVPDAIFTHYYHSEERESNFIEKESLTSAYKLSIKYAENKFKQYYREKLKTYLSNEEIASIAGSIIQYSDEYCKRASRIVRFDKHLLFAKKRIAQ